MLKDKLGPDSLIASPHSCMCSLFRSLFVLLYLLYSIVCSLLFACVFRHFLQWLVAACAFSGRLAQPLCWARLEVGLPALEQRLQQQQKAVEDLGAALEET